VVGQEQLDVLDRVVGLVKVGGDQQHKGRRIVCENASVCIVF